MFLRAMQYLALVLIDLFAFYSALLSAVLIRAYLLPTYYYRPPLHKMMYWEHLLIWWLPVTFLASVAYELPYAKRYPLWQECWQLIKAVGLAFLIVLSVVSLGKMSADVSRALLGILWLGAMITFPTFRWAGKRLMYKLGLWKERVLILGAGQAGMSTLRGIEREKNLGYQVIGFLDDNHPRGSRTIRTALAEYKVFGPVRHFRKFVRMMKISTMIIAMPSTEPSKLARIVSDVQRYVTNVLVVPELKGIALLNTELQALFMEQLFLLNIRNNLKSLSSRIIKRTFDFVVSSILLVLLSPLYLVVYLAVRLTSPGGAFFTQYRPGKNGKIIRIYKFRTMHVDGDKRLADALKNDQQLAQEWHEYRKLRSHDPRVTPVGTFLRKWSLDELPQIFNVWKGEMSMVGPRPYMVNEIERFKDVAEIIFMAKPGICGLWQSSGRNKLPFEDRVELETWYVLNWSLWLDIILMAKTAVAVLRAEGAY